MRSTLTLPNIGAGAILADPPWRFKTYSAKGEGRSACRHYLTMPFDAIAALPVHELAAKDCWLFLWAPACFLPQALELMAAWGFQYSSSAFRWVKRNKFNSKFRTSLGHTTRKSVEDCWLGKRGSPRRNAKNVGELIVAPVREHSRKPDEQYELIQRYCSGPYLELFARQQWPNWTCIGDEADKFSLPSNLRPAESGAPEQLI